MNVKSVAAVLLTAFIMFFVGYHCGNNDLIAAREHVVDVIITARPTTKPTPTPAPSYKPLAKGDRGEEVTALQERLVKLGYSVGTVDGIYGDKTAAAVSAFQKEASLSASGNADSSTLAVLYSVAAFRYMAPQPTPRPTVKPPPRPTPKPTPTPKPERMVWITKYGECWHTRPNCGNTQYPREVTLSYALEHGYRRCGNCG